MFLTYAVVGGRIPIRVSRVGFSSPRYNVLLLQLLYQTLELSKDTLTRIDLVTFNPNNIKSDYFFLSRILEMLPILTHLTISKVMTSEP